MSMSRRDLCHAALAGGAASLVPGLAAAAVKKAQGGAPGTRKLARIGLITGTIGKALKEDFVGAIKKVAAIGYKELEGGGGGKAMPDADFKKLVADLGMTSLAGGGAMKQLQDGLDSIIERAAFFEKKYVICYWPWADKGQNKMLDDWKRLGDTLNQMGAKVKAASMRLAYHNHNIEFAITEGKIPYDTLLARTDPSLVDMEMDLYWVKKGGQDPIPYLNKYPGRVAIFHVKDMDKTPAQDKTCPGQGLIDFAPIFAASVTAGVKHYVVENEGSDDPIPCIEGSYAYLSKLRY